MSSDVQRITGLRLDPYFSASKIAWLLEHNPEWRARIDKDEIAVGTIDSWLIYKLTGGEHVIDVTNASLLYYMTSTKWHGQRSCAHVLPYL